MADHRKLYLFSLEINVSKNLRLTRMFLIYWNYYYKSVLEILLIHKLHKGLSLKILFLPEPR